MKKAQLPECGLCRKSAVLLAIFFAIVSNLPAQGPSPSPSPPPGAQAPVVRDAQGNLVPASSASATAERVIVTGSNIPTAEEVGVNPVDIYNCETMSKSGQRTTEQFLQSLPTVNANIIPQSNNENGSNTAVGTATIAQAIFGVGNDTTNITGVLNYYHRNDIFQRDRAYSIVPPFLRSNNSPYNLSLSSDVAAAAGGPNLSPGGTIFASPPDLTNGLA